MILSQFIVPAATFYTTYYENLGGILDIFNNPALARAAQAFTGAFGSMVFLSFWNKGAWSSSTLKHAAMVGATAGAAALITHITLGILNMQNPMIVAGAAAVAVYYSNVIQMSVLSD
jgi:hypothetical protein